MEFPSSDTPKSYGSIAPPSCLIELERFPGWCLRKTCTIIVPGILREKAFEGQVNRIYLTSKDVPIIQLYHKFSM